MAWLNPMQLPFKEVIQNCFLVPKDAIVSAWGSASLVLGVDHALKHHIDILLRQHRLHAFFQLGGEDIHIFAIEQPHLKNHLLVIRQKQGWLLFDRRKLLQHFDNLSLV